MQLVWIGVFGVMGVYSRYFLGSWLSVQLSFFFPYATLLINVLGCFLAGVVYVLGIEHVSFSPEIRSAIMVGFLGGFTTFSAFGLEVTRLIEETEYSYAAVYLGLSCILGIGAVFAGLIFTRFLLGSSSV